MTRETATGYDGMRFSRLMPLSSRRAGERVAAKRDSGYGNLAAPPILCGQGPAPRSQVAQSRHPTAETRRPRWTTIRYELPKARIAMPPMPRADRRP